MDIMDVYILLDRTGSMQPIWYEAIAAINAYVQNLVKDEEQYRLTLAVFDHHGGFKFDILRDAIPLQEWLPFEVTEVTPRGTTPLLDAMAKIISIAEKRNTEKTAVVIITDGHENASRKTTQAKARAAIDHLVQRGWQILFLGANFDMFDQAQALGIHADRQMNAAQGNLEMALLASAEKTRRFNRTGQDMDFDQLDRKQAGEDQVTKPKRNPKQR